MGRIFLSAGQGGRINGSSNPGSVVGGTTEAREMILTRDLVVTELRSRGVEVLVVPDTLSVTGAIDWINARARRDDVAMEMRMDAFSNPSVRGAAAYYIANNNDRRQNAELLLTGLIRRVPQLPSRGARPDTDAGLGSLPFCRQIVPPSIVMVIGFLTNPDDRFIIQNQRRDVALGLADGLVSWLRGTPLPSPATFPEINISLNDRPYGEKGILVSGNAFVPVDLAERLNLDLSKSPNIRRINYRQVVFIRAVDLRDFNIAVGWNAQNRTVLLRSILQVPPEAFERIMGRGYTTEVQLVMFLKANNPDAPTQYPDLAQLYIAESNRYGVSYDMAFSQMLLETNSLRFGGDVKPSQNNFAGLGDVAGGPEGASFPNAQIGVRAHVQLLKAYASTEPIPPDEIVAPRFRFVTRGIAPTIDQLTGRWSADPDYGTKIKAILRNLYESAKLI